MEHQFNVQLAKEYGIEEAILIHNLFFWINKNAANERHFYDGHYWTYNTQKALSDLFPYINETKIQRCLKVLYEKGIIIKGNYNKNKLDRTCWYAFTDNAITILQNEGYDVGKMKNAYLKYEVTIPYSKHTDSNTDNKEDTNVSKKDDLFEKVWKEYERHGTKQKAKEAWRKLSDEEKQKVLIHIKPFKQSRPDINFRPHLHRYIRDKIYLSVIRVNNNIIYDPEKEYNANEYHPIVGGCISWDEIHQCYRCFNPWDLYNLPDGYKPEARPDGAVIYCQATKYVWSKEKQEWIESR